MTRAPLLAIGLACLALGLGSGCQTLRGVAETGAEALAAGGVISDDQAGAIRRSGEALADAFETLTPEQEYYVGRTVAALLTTRYTVYEDPRLQIYINTLGQALALHADVPETFAGYFFLVLDSDEINAFAAPGGFILVTRGMLRICRTEDELAAVLAHEIAHVQHRHGLQSIRRSRWTGAVATLAAETAKTLGSEELAELTQAFEGVISDITATLVNRGYSRAFEREADRSAVRILARTGYDPRALVTMLEQMETRLPASGPGFTKTHPPPRSRIREIRPLIPAGEPPPPVLTRHARFRQHLDGV